MASGASQEPGPQEAGPGLAVSDPAVSNTAALTAASPFAVPHEDDVKVAGLQRSADGAPAGDTKGLDSVPGEPQYPGFPGPMGPGDEIVGGPGLAGSRSSGGGRRTGLKVAVVAAGALVVVGGGAVAAMAMTGGSAESKGAEKTTVASQKLADAAQVPQVDPKVMEAQRKKQALDRASRAVRAGGGKGPSLQPKGTPIPTKTPTSAPSKGGGGSGVPSGDPVPAGEAQAIAKAMLPSYGFSGTGQFSCLVNLWNKESHWNTHAANPSGAYGIPQALPGSKMSSAGSDWQNSAKTQIKWGLGYIKNRYGTPCGAWSHSQSTGWY